MKLMVIDGNSIANRAYYGVRGLSASDGTPTNAVYGFVAMLQRLLRDDAPDALCVAFDLPGPTFRHERYTGYKAQRAKMPDDLAEQMPIIKSVLDAMRIERRELPGWEADDLIGAMARQCEGAGGWDCVIVTGDRDIFQLISPRTTVKHVKTRAGKNETFDYTERAFMDEYGFEPKRIVDLKALMGDPSDNIPGVAGVGEKTATDLVRRYGGIERIYGDLGSLDIKERVRKLLADGRDSAFMSYWLAEIRCDAPIEFTPGGVLLAQPDNDALRGLFQKLEFHSFSEKLGLASPPGVPSGSFVQRRVATPEEASAMLRRLRASPLVSVSVSPELDSIALADGSGDVFILKSSDAQWYGQALAEIFGVGIRKSGHNVKDTMRKLSALGITSGGWEFDVALAAYLLSPTEASYDLERLAMRYLGSAPPPEDVGAPPEQSTLFDGGERADSGGSYTLASRLAHSAAQTRDLSAVLPRLLDDGGLTRVYRDIDMPLCSVLADMESVGFMVDKDALRAYGDALAESMRAIEGLIYAQAGESFNINSPKQLGRILFDVLKLPAPKKNKTGFSTSAEVLDGLADKHPIIDLIKNHRLLSKLKSTYTDALFRDADADSRVHTSFQMTVAATGRLSSVRPNLQSIPVRTGQGEQLRRMFVAGDGNMLVDADYSQIELRILAHIAGDSRMTQAFNSGGDIHAETASQVFGVPPESVTALQRRRAKAVNFGIVYGISAYSLASDIGVPVKEAQSYIDSYLENFSGVRAYMKDIVDRANRDGYVTTMFGRRRMLPELKSSNRNTRMFGERVALNMPIQGAAADIIKLAMIDTARRISARNMRAKLILQVHDELIVECPESEAAATTELLREAMEGAASLSVPLVAQARAGKSWYDAK
ncbi:MAG: DNA polymerase I [Oscillospiraceae bacterium]|jgi:DNA polymerase-1|nr:DNA polymerase I [Oscillospiraceae bacterium]